MQDLVLRLLPRALYPYSSQREFYLYSCSCYTYTKNLLGSLGYIITYPSSQFSPKYCIQSLLSLQRFMFQDLIYIFPICTSSCVITVQILCHTHTWDLQERWQGTLLLINQLSSNGCKYCVCACELTWKILKEYSSGQKYNTNLREKDIPQCQLKTPPSFFFLHFSTNSLKYFSLHYNFHIIYHHSIPRRKNITKFVQFDLRH